MLLVWVHRRGLVTLTGALTIAELAAAYPRSGGIFAYILEAFGPLPAFLYGWAELTVIRAAAIGGHLHGLRHLPGGVPSPHRRSRSSYVAAAAIILVGAAQLPRGQPRRRC